MEKFLQKVRTWLEKAGKIPLFGNLAEDLLTLIDLLADYCAGVCRNLPKGVFLAAAFGLGYALCPIDLILDIIPFAGYLDDAAILMLLLDFFIARDIQRYRSWKTALQSRGLAALRDSCTADILALIGQKHLAAAYLTEKKQIRLLLCEPQDRSRPLPCRSIVTGIPGEPLKALGVDSWDEIGAFYTGLFQDPRIPWSYLGRRPFMPEYDPRAKSDEFVTE